MAKTRKFNTTVKLGNKTYAPGEDVPITDKGLSDAAADNLDQVFGLFRTSAEGSTSDRRIAALTEERDSLADQVTNLTAERDALTRASKSGSADLTALTAERDKLAADLKTMTAERDQLEEDNGTLADELQKLQSANSGDTGDKT
ncbi:hypothetical protein FJU08_12745 [Martelella alba]|uniref:Uncharacterized protein n=1 Tax=Martelella alba TaxID=2590451 RepID=A0A506U754_9HYPH|nr:hypothetical protein [Martelella alba]TPW29680.1 hypothetical protein FJU08_12745 [Martelella alba]